MQPQERQLVPVASLELDKRIPHMEETAPTKSKGVPPLQNRPLAILEQILDEAHHLRSRELACKHLATGCPTFDRRLCHLMVNRRLTVETGQRFYVGPVEGFDPRLDDLFGAHDRSLWVPPRPP